MPELPEVETMCRGIRPIIGGKIERVEFPPCRLRPMLIKPPRAAFRRRLAGQVVAAVERLGKRVVVRFETGLVQVFEPRMTGLVLVSDPPNQTHLRMAWHLSGSPVSQLLFWDRRGLGTLTLMTDRELSDNFDARALGPDALRLEPGQLRSRLSRSQRAIKVALLDQKTVAGIGNLYAAEILHVARVHPARACRELSGPQWKRIDVSIQTVLTAAVHYEGSTLGDGTYRNALNQSGTYQNHHRVYARAGQPCPDCGATIQRMVQAQRATFWCPACQRKS